MDPGTSTQYFGTTEGQWEPADTAAGHEYRENYTNETANLTKKKPKQKRKRNISSSLAQRNIIGCRISHKWKEGDGTITHWTGTVLDQVALNPTLYLVKYDGIDCVYGLELHHDERVLSLKVLSGAVKSSSPDPDPNLANTIIGKVVEHLFEGEHGSKDSWRGMVLGLAPILNAYFYITYTNDPILYMYQLLDDYKEGNLRIMPDYNEGPRQDVDLEYMDGMIGKPMEYTNDDGSIRVGKVIHKLEVRPSVYFVKFDDDFHIYVYDVEKNN